MSLKEQVLWEVESLPETELRYVADYLAFLKFRAHRKRVPVRLPDEEALASLYAEFAEEDRALAEEGIAEYARILAEEDEK